MTSNVQKMLRRIFLYLIQAVGSDDGCDEMQNDLSCKPGPPTAAEDSTRGYHDLADGQTPVDSSLAKTATLTS